MSAPTAAATTQTDALTRCVGTPERFLDEIWERRVHLSTGADGQSLLDLDDVDTLLADAALRAPAFRLVQAGTPVPPERYLRSARVGSRTVRDLIDVGKVHRLFADGATVVLQGLHRYWPPLTSFCRQLEERLTHPCQANAYLTPPVSSGLRVHADTHDVLALQTHGRKHWVAYPSGSALDDLPAPVLDHHLSVGECLYVPRGAPHAARTVDAVSLHITIGVRVTTWRDALRRAVSHALDATSLDEALPPGYAHQPEVLSAELAGRLQALAGTLAETDTSAVAGDLASRFLAGRQPERGGQLRELVSLDLVDDDTVLRHRAGVLCRIAERTDGTDLVLTDRTVTFPPRLRPALRWLEQNPSLRVGDLEAFLDEPGRRVLATRLIREGLLTRRG